jgi:hypothetical protein
MKKTGFGTREDLKTLRYELDSLDPPKLPAGVPLKLMPFYRLGYQAGFERSIAVLEERLKKLSSVQRDAYFKRLK